MNKLKEIINRLEDILGCLTGSHISNDTPENQLEELIKEMKSKENDVVLDNLIKPFKCCKETDKCDIQCDDCKMVYNL